MWASGNGGNYDDDCGTDGYVSSIYTIAVGAIGVDGRPSSIDERCSGKMVVAYVTDQSGKDATVRLINRHHHYNNDKPLCFRPPQIQMQSAHMISGRQVQQLLWCQELLLWLWRQSEGFDKTS